MADAVQNPSSTTPQMVPGVDMRSLPIGPEEAFVLSRIDGRSPLSEIAASTGMTQEHVSEILTRLARLGAVAYGDTKPEPKPVAEPSEIQGGAKLSHPVIETVEEGHPSSAHPAAALYDPSELDEAVELELQRKRQILDTFYRLDSSDYYQLLGVERHAEKKEIKGAYYGVVSLFHPDKYFGKRLGSFKPKLERIFQTLTEAHDTLTRKTTRQEYDAYLTSQERTRALDNMMTDDRRRAREVNEVKRLIEQQARVLERASARPPAPNRASSPPPPRKSEPPPDDAARRKQAARKLRNSVPPGGGSSKPPPRDGGVQEIVGDDIRRRYEDRLSQARDSQIDHYRRAAETALEAKDPVSAANALRIAVGLAPDDAELAAHFEAVQSQANAALAESYIEQAQYEERNGHFAEAALSYEKAARGRPGAFQLFERAAHCLIEANVNAHKALELARKAVELNNERVDLRVTLARAFLASDMKQSAVAEIERALQIDSNDETAQDWLKRLKRES
ncbi:MAG: DnaJ domain-containing protein [Polyangiaceae bacterium]